MPAPLSDHFAIMVQRLAALRVPQSAGEGDGNDLRDLSDHMVQVADAVDSYFAAIGREVIMNSPIKIDAALFEPVFDAIQGNALFEIDRAANARDAEYQDVA